MTYELAKELKDAGFPQHDSQSPDDHEDGCMSDGVCTPSLDELIEACGDIIFNLLRQSEWHTQQTGFQWEALGTDVRQIASLTPSNIDGAMKKGYGRSPEEAVAKLWLTLHNA